MTSPVLTPEILAAIERVKGGSAAVLVETPAPPSPQVHEQAVEVPAEPATSSEDEDAINKEAEQKIFDWLREGKSDAEIKIELDREYDGDFTEQIKAAHVRFADELEKERASYDRARAAAGQAKDKELAADFEAKKLRVENWCLRNKKQMVTDPVEIERYHDYVKELEEAEARADSLLSNLEDQSLPEFPRFTGSLHDLAVALCPDLPYEFKFMAAVTHFGLMRSGLDRLEGDEYLQPRFYVCFVKDVEWGKTGAPKEVKKCVSGLASYVITPSVDSGPALVDEFVDALGKVPVLAKDRIARVLLNVDEMKDLFEKSKVTANSKNSLSNELLKLYEDNVTGNHSRKHGKATMEVAHLAILGGATPDGYAIMWNGTGGASTGLQSRFVAITTSAPKPPVRQRASDGDALGAALLRIAKQANASPQLIRFDAEADEILQKWDAALDKNKPSTARVSGFVKRLLLVLASTNDTAVVGKEMMLQAVRFGDYVIACREKFNPADSYSWIQAFEQMILAIAEKYPDREMTQNDYVRLIKPAKKPGGFGAFGQGWKNVTACGALIKSGVTSKNTPKYRLP